MESVFLKLLNMSITAGWMILAVIVLRLLLRKAPKWISCLLWALVAVRLMCPFSIESIFSVIPSSEPISQETVISSKPSIDSGVSLVDNAVNPVIQESFTPNAGVSANPMQVWLFVAGVVWCAGVFFMLLYACVSYLRLRCRVRTAVRLRDSVYISEFVDTPFILGIARPRIYLPCGMEESVAEPVIAHEQAHLGRRDHWWKPLGYMLLAVYWFQPLCWVAYCLLCRDIELACDEKVIKDYNPQQKKAYSEALLSCSITRHSIAACPLAFGEVGVRERIKSVLHYQKPAFRMIVVAVLVCAVAAVCLVTDPVEDKDIGVGKALNTQDYGEQEESMASEEIRTTEDTGGATGVDTNQETEKACREFPGKLFW